MNSDDQLAAIRRMSNISSYGVINGLMGSRIVDSLPLRVRCECDLLACEENIEIILSQRRELRRRYPRGFIVATAHMNSSQDTSLFVSEVYSVVEKARFTEEVTDL